MKLFLLLPDLQSKNFFYKIFLTSTKESKTGLENRKWNYPNRKWNYFSYFLSSKKKTFYKMLLLTSFENKKWNYSNRKWNYFYYFLTSNHKIIYIYTSSSLYFNFIYTLIQVQLLAKPELGTAPLILSKKALHNGKIWASA